MGVPARVLGVPRESVRRHLRQEGKEQHADAPQPAPPQWKAASYTNKLRVLVVDLDSASAPARITSLGSAIVAATRQNAQGIVDNVGYAGHITPKGTLGWEQVDTAVFPDVQSVVDAVYDEQAWAAVVGEPHTPQCSGPGPG